jgi:SAM-dependent methyltransferase
VALCRTDTGDFDDLEIRHVVHDRGQLYLDRSGKASIDDFGRDVLQLVLSKACRACPDLPTCCACYEAAERSYFHDDEAWLRNAMGAFEGDVLDVGMGQVPYLDTMAAGISAGTVRYHGLDPDPGVVEATASLGLPVQTHLRGIENFDGPESSFDHVVAIRSLNHFIDVRRALAVMVRVARPDATLTLIESLALPLLRSRRQATVSHDAAFGGFQHLRNWGSEDVLPILESLPVTVSLHRPVGIDTCDQWIIQFRRNR